MTKTLFLAVLMVLLAGCARLDRIRPTDFNVESVSPQGFRKAEVVLSVGVDNPAGEIAVSEIYGEAMLSGKVIGKLAMDPFVVKARTEETYRIKADVTLDDSITLFEAMRMAGNSAALDKMMVNLYAKVKVRGGAAKKIRLEGIPMKELLKLLKQ